MHFWEDSDLYDCIRILAWAGGDVTKECGNDIWKKTGNKYFIIDQVLNLIITGILGQIILCCGGKKKLLCAL